MKKTETYHDEALRIIMRQQAENAQQMEFPEDLADLLMQRIEQKEALKQKALQRKRRWIAVGIAAAWALLVGVALHVFHQDDKKTQQVTVRKPEIKNDSIPEKETEEVTKDSANVIKEIERLQYEVPRLPVAQRRQHQLSSLCQELGGLHPADGGADAGSYRDCGQRIQRNDDFL